MTKQPKRRLKLSIRTALYTTGLMTLSLALYGLAFSGAFEHGQEQAVAFAKKADDLKNERAIAASERVALAVKPDEKTSSQTTPTQSDPSDAAAGQTVPSPSMPTQPSAPEDSSAQVPESDLPASSQETPASSQESSASEETQNEKAEQKEDTSRDHGFSIHQADGTLQKTILIDAGHGGSDLGDGAKDGTQEKNVTLDFAKRLKAHLEKQNPDLHVEMVRSDDSRLAESTWNDTNARIAAQEKTGANYVISLHAHALDDENASGFQVILNDDDPITGQLASRISSNLATVGYLPDRGVLTTTQYPLQMVSMSNSHAIELDLAALSHKSDLDTLHDDKKMEAAAAAVAAAISDTIVQNPDAPDYVSRQKLNSMQYQN